MLELQDKVARVSRCTEIATVLHWNLMECKIDDTEMRENYLIALEDALGKLSLLVTDLRDSINEAANLGKSA